MSTNQNWQSPNSNQQRSTNNQGSGELGSLAKRSMFIGSTLVLYFALVIWLPLQFYDEATDYCNYRCDNYAMVVSSGITITYTVDGEDVTVPAAIAGCYESSEPTCEATCKETCSVCESSVATCEIYEATLYETFHGVEQEERATAYLLIWLFSIIALATVIVGSISMIKCNEKGGKIIAGVLGISALLVIIGAILYVSQWPDDDEAANGFEDIWNATQCLVFVERIWPCLVAITLAVDWYNSALNDADKRMKAWTVPLFMASLSGAVCMTIIINYEPDAVVDVDWEYPLYSQGACIAAGYYIMAAMALATILVWGGYVNSMNSQKSKFGLAALLVSGAVITACGYWAFIAAAWDCDTTVDLDGVQTLDCDGSIGWLYTVADAAGWVQHHAGEGVTWEGKYKAYYIGYTFFVLLMSGIIAYDMDIVANYKSVR
eukprot:201806_1